VATGRHIGKPLGGRRRFRYRAGRQSASGQCVKSACTLPPVGSPAATLRFGQNRFGRPHAHRIDLPADQIARSITNASRARNQSPAYQQDRDIPATPQNVKCYFYTESQGQSFRFGLKQFLFRLRIQLTLRAMAEWQPEL